jgi:uracil-DNA glycosylase family 4
MASAQEDWRRYAPRAFDPACRLCPRLAGHLDAMRARHPDYYNAPVPPFVDPAARVLIVGLAPGAHGANRTGRPFTGDFAGILLYETLHAHGFATAPASSARGDGLTLVNRRISNAVKCQPPENKPTGGEVATCNRYLAAELERFAPDGVLLALGAVAHGAALRALGLKLGAYRFAHGAEYGLSGGRTLVDSYHCSRYNTQTRRLTTAMFESVVARVRALIALSDD